MRAKRFMYCTRIGCTSPGITYFTIINFRNVITELGNVYIQGKV